jgi:hypothetical protein
MAMDARETLTGDEMDETQAEKPITIAQKTIEPTETEKTKIKS